MHIGDAERTAILREMQVFEFANMRPETVDTTEQKLAASRDLQQRTIDHVFGTKAGCESRSPAADS